MCVCARASVCVSLCVLSSRRVNIKIIQPTRRQTQTHVCVSHTSSVTYVRRCSLIFTSTYLIIVLPDVRAWAWVRRWCVAFGSSTHTRVHVAPAVYMCDTHRLQYYVYHHSTGHMHTLIGVAVLPKIAPLRQRRHRERVSSVCTLRRVVAVNLSRSLISNPFSGDGNESRAGD